MTSIGAVTTAAGTGLRVEDYRGSAAEWDAFAEAQRGFTHFHRYGWRRVMERVHGHECRYLFARDQADALAGVLPLVRVKSVLFGHFLVSMPFLNYGGPLGTDDAVRALAARAVALAEGAGATLLEMRSRVELPLDLPVSDRKITRVLDLEPGNPEAAWKALTSRLRNKIRKAQRAGLAVKFGAEQVGPFFEVFSHHMRDLGTPTQPRRFFEEIAETFPDDSVFAVGYLWGQPVACGAGFLWGGELEMSWASALLAYRDAQTNVGTYWSVIEYASQRGCRLFNFGRSTPGSGPHQFKQSWGGRDERLWWYDVSRDGKAVTPSPTDSKYAWGPRLWKRIPVPLATAVGPHIVRFIP